MSEENTQAALLDKAKAMYGVRITCTHNHVTLVQHSHVEIGWFACWQCDDCGAITQQEVTAIDLDAALNAPALDVKMYMEHTRERMPDQEALAALTFIAKAAKR